MFAFALSGLQDFLYHEVEDGGAARRLRIRSALLSLAPALVAHAIRDADAAAEIVYLGGGKLLMAASADATGRVESPLRELHEWLARASEGRLGACWTATDDATPSASAVRRLLDALSRAKWQAGRFDGAWSGAGAIHRVECKTLGNKAWESDQGASLARRTELTGFRVFPGGDWEIGPWHVSPVADRNPDIALAGRAEGPIAVSIPLHTPRSADGETATLSDLAQEGEGAPYLALLKLDGDGIGALMAKTLEGGESLDRFSQTSGKLSSFFGRSLMDLLAKEFPRLYLVYSGGDDLVATGHFDAVLSAALRIQAEYGKLGLGTVSAGVSLYTRNSPILKAVEAAERELETAKETRNAISVAGCRLGWEEMRLALGECDALVTAIQGESFNRGSLQLLRQLGEPWLPRVPAEPAALRLRSIPQMNYMRSRREWKPDRWPEGLRRFFDSLCEDETAWPRASLVGTLAGWKTKRREDGR